MVFFGNEVSMIDYIILFIFGFLIGLVFYSFHYLMIVLRIIKDLKNMIFSKD